ncbi:hypothetical protein Namu_5054 [Nakamurella multipartita DSM 44233]|uniref:Uncharacterized protein n=1 Tax=Nakamurella multipartita (strain ATCC 700099 / DSM 44233 / CIP 104796 / JCM 9543 / NBRC 105858 / Y-104) TaxID=479431 RepID=C8XB33_NAKMY|nr:hypothetical protein Namu_5054 [Nakamurella multipartita DSM 44233]
MTEANTRDKWASKSRSSRIDNCGIRVRALPWVDRFAPP